MAKIDILWTDIRYTQSFNVLIDFPVKYEDFAANKEFDDIREYMDKFCNYMLLMLTVDIPDYVPEKTTDKIYLFLNYDIIDYYKDILWSIYDVLWLFFIWPVVTVEEKKQYLDNELKNWKYDRLYFILDVIKSLWNENKMFPKNNELAVDLMKDDQWRHKQYFIDNSYVLWNKKVEMVNNVKENMKKSPLIKSEYYRIKRIFREKFFKQEIHKNQILNYIFFLFFLWKRDLYISFQDFSNSIYLCDSKNMHNCIWWWSIIINIWSIFPFVWENILKWDLKIKYQNYIKSNFWNTNILHEILEDIKRLIGKTKTWKIKIEYKDFKPSFMSWIFKTTELWKYQELKDYTWDYWYVATQNHNWKASVLVWEKLFKYSWSWI